MRIIGFVVLASLLCGCVSTYKQSDVTAADAKLQRGRTVTIAQPENGSYNGREYRDSGRSTAMAVRGAALKHASQAEIVPECRDVECLTKRSPTNQRYFVVPVVLHWEDRNTEWSGIKDKLEVKISVYDAPTGLELASTVISGKSKWMTFGGDHPQDLLAEPIGQYFDSLY